MKKSSKITALVCLLIIVCLGAGFYFSCNHTVKGMDEYQKTVNDDSDYINFELDELGEYENIDYQRAKTGGLLFSSTGSMLVAQYSENEFLNQLNIVNNFDYQTVPVHIYSNETEMALPEPEFKIGVWNFKVLKNRSLNYSYPKSIDFIAVNEKERQIAYMTFYDQDLDYLCDTTEADGYMAKFVDKYFSYNFDKV